MFRLIESTAGRPQRVEDRARDVAPPLEKDMLWLDVTSPTEEALATLGAQFGFHPLALEDCLQEDQRPKAEEYGAYTFLVTQGCVCPSGNLHELDWYELHVFLGKNYLVTVHEKAIPALEQVWRRVTGDEALMKKGVDFVYYLLCDRIADESFPILDRIADALEQIEDCVMTGQDDGVLPRIFGLKGSLVLMRKILSPQRDVMAMLSRRGDARISERTAIYFRDVYDSLARIVESIESNRDLLGNALEAHKSAQSQRTNDIMKTLTLMSALFMPLTFITGFFGQNFEHLPFGSDALMWTMIVSCVGLPGAFLYWFKRKHWF